MVYASLRERGKADGLLGHAVVDAKEDIDFSSLENFEESVSAYINSSCRGRGLLWPIMLNKGNEFKNGLLQNILGDDEAILFFSGSKKMMASCFKQWAEFTNEKTYIASKRQLAIVCGSYSKINKTVIGTLIKGKGSTVVHNAKTVKSNFQIFKIRKNLIDPLYNKMSSYSMTEAKRDVKSYNFENNFYYCYVGMPKFGPIDVDMTVLINKAITPPGLASWLKSGTGATKI